MARSPACQTRNPNTIPAVVVQLSAIVRAIVSHGGSVIRCSASTPEMIQTHANRMFDSIVR